MKKLLWAAGLAAFLLSGGTPAQAQQGPSCNTRDKVLAHLAGKYSEAPVAVGVTSSGALLEVLSAPNGGTWTVILTRPDGLCCLLAAGEGWQPLHDTADPSEGRVSKILSRITKETASWYWQKNLTSSGGSALWSCRPWLVCFG